MRQTEVEQLQQAVAPDQDVRGLDVAVQLARAVQVDESGDQLEECGLKSIEIARQHACRTRPRDRLGTDPRDLVRQDDRRELGRGMRRQLAQPAAGNVGDEVRPVNQLHGNEPWLLIGDELVQGNEIGMREVRECTKLALQPEEAPGVRAAEQLERHACVTLQVEGFVDDTEPALAETSLDAKALVVAQHLARYFRGASAAAGRDGNCSSNRWRSASGMP